MNRKPEVSVVMGVYNGENKLAATLESISSQTLEDHEFIIVDDGSTDCSSSILRSHCRSDPRVRIVRQPNLGLTRALIKGCALANGKYLARQDVGDTSLPRRLELQATLLGSNDRMVVASCLFEVVDPEGDLLISAGQQTRQEEISESLILTEEGRMVGPMHGTVMMRRNAYEQVGGYREQFYFAQDMDLWTRLIEIGEFGMVEEVLCRIEFSPEGISGKYGSRQIELGRLIEKCRLCRRTGKSEAKWLELAARIRPGEIVALTDDVWDADYFIASCLSERRSPKAKAHYWELIRQRPGKFKAWIKLMASLLY